MEPMVPSSRNRFYAFSVGFIAGVGAQVLFRMLVIAVIGPVSVLLSGRTAALVALLLLPPLATLLFVRLTPGSVSEDFFRGFQVGCISWLIAILATL